MYMDRLFQTKDNGRLVKIKDVPWMMALPAMPVPGEDYYRRAFVYIGTTDTLYTRGVIYHCTRTGSGTDGDPYVYAWTASRATNVANGLLVLNSSGLIDEAYLPGYVDDVVEGYYYDSAFYEEAEHTTEITAETGKLYADITSVPSLTYRWTGSAYAAISINDAVRYGTQTLTDPQKLQARLNIDAAGLNKTFEYGGRDLSAIFADAAALHTAIAAGNFQNIRVGDYWPETLAGTYRDYGLFTCPIGTDYYSDTALTTLVGQTAELLAATYVSDVYCSVSISSTTYYVAHDDCLEYYERTINALMKFEVGAINPYIRYGDTELTAPHVAFVPRDCIPTTLKFRKANAAWHPHYHTAAGDGTTVAFTIPETPASLISVKVDGVAKSSPGDYSITGAVITFTSAPANEAVIVVKYLWTDNPWLGSALYETLNNATYGLLPIIAATALGAYLFAGPNSLGMRFLGETKASGATNATGWAWYNRGKIWVPMEREVWSSIARSEQTNGSGLAIQFPIFAGTTRHVVKGLGNGGSRCNWWCGSSHAGSSTYICSVYGSGLPTYYNAENTDIAVAPCFLIS